MLWIIGTAALLLSVFLAFRFAETRLVLFATLAIIAILTSSAVALFFIETRQNAERQQINASRVTPADITISGASLDFDYGRWRLSGKLTNNGDHPVTSLTLHVTVKDCPKPDPCKITGDTNATHYGIDVPPGETQPFDMLLYLPDTPKPKAMQWDYEVADVGSGR